jgi:Kef-type K+ transport system membrane component KefB
MTDADLALRLFLQLVVILATCRLFGWLGRKLFGQPQVVMEMIAGVTLGPSLFGLIWPAGQQWLFPSTLAVLAADGLPVLDAAGHAITVRHPSMQILFVVSQLGLVLYMFMVGLHLNLDMVRLHGRSATMVSLWGIVGPVFLGAAATFALFGRGDMFEPAVQLPVAMLFLGAAMCVTAFPVLSRIIEEKGISKTKIGSLTLAAGASNDVVAWIILAVVLTVLKSDQLIAISAMVGGLIFVGFMLTFGRRLFAWMSRIVDREGEVPNTIYATTLLILIATAFYTDYIGIYAVFGSFIVGTCIPRGKFAETLRERTEPVTAGLLVPLFFVFAGLNTRIGLLNTVPLWLITALVVGVAIAGKAFSCAFAAKWSGQSWRESWAIGTLMNARGLMELIMINIGLQAHVITPVLYTMLVLMAILTTVMTSPIFELFYRRLKVLENNGVSDAKVLPA